MKLKNYRFMRQNGQPVTSTGISPLDAWDNLCDSYDNDYFMLKVFTDVTANTRATQKQGYQWLNCKISIDFDGNFGPVYFEPM